MTMIVVDKELREKLKDMDHEVVFRDEAGQTLGRYIPEADYVKMIYSQVRHLFREEDLEKARQKAVRKVLEARNAHFQKNRLAEK